MPCPPNLTPGLVHRCYRLHPSTSPRGNRSCRAQRALSTCLISWGNGAGMGAGMARHHRSLQFLCSSKGTQKWARDPNYSGKRVENVNFFLGSNAVTVCSVGFMDWSLKRSNAVLQVHIWAVSSISTLNAGSSWNREREGEGGRERAGGRHATDTCTLGDHMNMFSVFPVLSGENIIQEA